VSKFPIFFLDGKCIRQCVSVATTSSQVAQGTELFFESQMACDSPSFLNLVDLGFQQRVKQKASYV
jgi:hypothetical protein